MELLEYAQKMEHPVLFVSGFIFTSYDLPREYKGIAIYIDPALADDECYLVDVDKVDSEVIRDKI